MFLGIRLENQVEEVIEEVDEKELTVFQDFLKDRIILNHGFDEYETQAALEDLFIHESYNFRDPDLAEAMDQELDEVLELYENEELFKVDVTGFEEPFERDFYRHKRQDARSNGFKEVYRLDQPIKLGDKLYNETIFLGTKPRREKNVEGMAQQVATWMHNIEVQDAHGINMPSEYQFIKAERNGRPYPGIIGGFNSDMVLANQMTEEQEKRTFTERARQARKATELVMAGEVASSKVNDYYGPGTLHNQAYDFNREEAVMPELGELTEYAFEQHDIIDCDSREEFIQRHRIDERAERYLEAYNL